MLIMLFHMPSEIYWLLNSDGTNAGYQFVGYVKTMVPVTGTSINLRDHLYSHFTLINALCQIGFVFRRRHGFVRVFCLFVIEYIDSMFAKRSS